MTSPYPIKAKSSANVNHHLVNGFNSFEKQAIVSKPEPSPRTYIYNKTTVDSKKKKRQRPSASERLWRKQKSKLELVRLLRKVRENELVARIEKCSQKFSATTCGKHVISRRPSNSCNHRLCPFCAPKRSRRIQEKYVPLAKQFLRVGKKSTPVHLVLTQAHRKNETLMQSRKRLMKSFKQLQKTVFWLNYFHGGIYAFEATVTQTGWHSHLHILAFRRRFFDVSLLRREWNEITGDSVNFRLDPVSDIESGLREIVKYISKPLDIEKFSPKQMREFLALKGARLFNAFGLFFNFCRRLDASDIEEDSESENYSGFCEGDCCPVCEKPLFEMLMTVKELIEFTRETETVPRQ